jgi:hypothetical protein
MEGATSIPRGVGDESRSQGRGLKLDWRRLGSAWLFVFPTTVTTKEGLDWIPEIHCHPSHTRSVGDSEHFVMLGGSYPVEDWCCWSIVFLSFWMMRGLGVFGRVYIPLASLPARYPGQFAGCEGTVLRRLVLLGSFNCFYCQGFLSQEIVIIQGWFLVVQYDLGVLMLCLRTRCLEI